MIDSRTKRRLVTAIRSQFRLGRDSDHGPSHWARVRVNALALAKLCGGVDTTTVELFALLHDSCRVSEFADPEHGARACDFARALRREAVFSATDDQFADLVDAMAGHSLGATRHQSISVMACWDADRLDLGRVGIQPDPDLLCLDESRTLIDVAFRRSEAHDVFRAALARGLGLKRSSIRSIG